MGKFEKVYQEEDQAEAVADCNVIPTTVLRCGVGHGN